MMDSLDLARFPDVALKVDAGLNNPLLKIDELPALRPGSGILNGRRACEKLSLGSQGQA